MKKDTKPKIEEPQCMPRVSYMLSAASGSSVAPIDRNMLAAAMADADLCLYTSVT